MKHISGRWIMYLVVMLGVCASHMAYAQTSSSSSSRSSSSRPATLPPLPSGYTVCASQGEMCSFTGTRKVIIDSCFEYTCWHSEVTGTNSVPCYGYLSMGFTRCAYSQSLLLQTFSLTATASNQSGTTRNAAKAVDGLLDTRWESSNSTAGNWLQVRTAQPISLKRIQITEYGNRIRYHRVEYLNGTVWTPLEEAGSTGGTLIVELATPVTTQAVRINMVAPTSGQPSISEFVVSGYPAPTR